MKDEGVNIRAQLGDQEGKPVGHEAAHEVDVAAEPIQLRHRHMTPELPCGGKGGLELWPAVHASDPLPVSTSTNSRVTVKPSLARS